MESEVYENTSQTRVRPVASVIMAQIGVNEFLCSRCSRQYILTNSQVVKQRQHMFVSVSLSLPTSFVPVFVLNRASTCHLFPCGSLDVFDVSMFPKARSRGGGLDRKEDNGWSIWTNGRLN